MRWWNLGIAVSLVLAAGCGAARSRTRVSAYQSEPAFIRTDREQYAVRAVGQGFVAEIVATFTNPRRDTLYVDLESAGALQARTEGRWVSTLGAPRRGMLRAAVVPPGTTYRATVRAYARRPTPVANARTAAAAAATTLPGVYRLVWLVYQQYGPPRRDVGPEAEGFRDLVPEPERVSNAFELTP